MPVKERSQEEILLRENIRKAIKVVLDRRSKESEQERLEEQTLRKVIRGMIAEAKEEQVYDSTGQNDLSDYMKTNAPTIIQDYMKLQSNDAEKLSFMAVLKFAIINLFQDLDVKQGRLGVDKLVETLNNLSEDIKVDIEDEFDGDPLQEPEDPEDTDEGIRFARELGFEMPEKLDYRGLQQALKAFNSSIKNQLEDAYNNYGPGQSEDAKTIANEPGMADMEAPDIPEIPEEEQEEEVVGLEEFVDLDELLSNL